MPRKSNATRIEAWTLDQLAKSVFFHRKLHEWQLLETSQQLDRVQGEHLHWDDLHIAPLAWNKVIHRGIKPVLIFAHPEVLRTVSASVGYYRMLAMVSQKSMGQVGFSLSAYESGKRLPDETTAWALARHLNSIISALIEADETIDPREFDLWRAMAAGAQAQGSWQNSKGQAAEIAIRELVLARLSDRQGLSPDALSRSRIDLRDGRTLVFADEPDIAIYTGQLPEIAVEIKGGIDSAGVLERIGAALKSLRRTRQENPSSITILILQDVSMTQRAVSDLTINTEIVTHLFSAKAILEDEVERERFFAILSI
jgi:transcriptional regulator with XRE-family HTH domain